MGVVRRITRTAALFCAAASALLFATGPSFADWSSNPNNAYWNGALNWSGGIPDQTSDEHFGTSTITTIVLSGQTSFAANSLTFNSGAPQYTFNIDVNAFGPGFEANTGLTVYGGAGITDNSGHGPIFNVTGLTSGGFTAFLAFGDPGNTGSAPSAGDAIINLNDASTLLFQDHAAAGASEVTVGSSGSAGIEFDDESMAGTASFTQAGGQHGSIWFRGDSSADSATITLHSVKVSDTADLGSAAITVDGSLDFEGFASGGTGARVTSTNQASLNLTNLDSSVASIELGALDGDAQVVLDSHSLTVGAALGLNDVSTFNGSIAGSGGITKTGDGTWVLEAVVGGYSYTGATSMALGTLQVDGDVSSSSSFSVGGNATLTGTGTVSGTTVHNGGSINPGDGTTPGTLNITGGLSFDNGAHMLVYLSGSSASRVSATGIVDLSNAPLLHFDITSPNSGTYTILTATGGITGQFNAGVDYGSLTGFHTNLIYAPNAITLQLGEEYAWSGINSGDWFDSGNWTSGHEPVSGDYVHFDASAATTAVSVANSSSASIGTMAFDSGAPAYTFDLDASAQNVSLTLSGGQGISNASAAPPTFSLHGTSLHTVTMAFDGSGVTADNAIFNLFQSSTLAFHNEATAGTSSIVFSTDLFSGQIATVNFDGTSTAGSATIDETDAASGNNLNFNGSSTAGAAHIHVFQVAFNNSSSLQNAHVDIGASLFFNDVSTAGVNSSIDTGTFGTLYIDSHAGDVTTGLLTGTGGNVNLGANFLVVANDNDGEYDGGIAGSGGISKSGVGVWTVGGTASYTGATTVSGGTLKVQGNYASSSGVTVTNGGTLSGGSSGRVDDLDIQSGGILSQANGLHVNGNMTFEDGSIYVVTLGSGGSTDAPGRANNLNFTGTGAELDVDATAAELGQTYILALWTGSRVINLNFGGPDGAWGDVEYLNLPTDFIGHLNYNDSFKQLELFFTQFTATYIWTGASNSDVTNGGNWNNSVPFTMGAGSNSLTGELPNGPANKLLAVESDGINFEAHVGTLQVDDTGYEIDVNAGTDTDMALVFDGNGIAGSDAAPTIALNGTSGGQATLVFNGISDAGSATINASGRSRIEMNDSAEATDALIFGDVDTVIDVSNSSEGASIGEITGNGRVDLGENLLEFGTRGTGADAPYVFDGSFTGCSCALLYKSGDTIADLTGSSPDFFGSIEVAQGTLLLDSDWTSAENITVDDGATLGGNGATLPGATIDGIVAPGTPDGFGTLTFTGGVTFSSGATFVADYTTDLTVNDHIVSAATVALDGTLEFDPTAGTVVHAGDAFTLIQAQSIAGDFATIVASLPGSLQLDHGIINDGDDYFVVQVDDDHTWKINPGSSDFLDDANWVGGAPGIEGTGTFGVSSQQTVELNNAGVATAVHIDSLVFNQPGYTLNINAGAGPAGDGLTILELDNGITDSSQTGANIHVMGQGGGNAVAMLRIDDGSLGHSNVTLENGAQLILWGGDSSSAAVSVSSGSTFFLLDSASIGALDGDPDGVVNIGGSVLTVGGLGGVHDFGGSVVDNGNGGGLLKVGSGTLALWGTLAYAGPTTVVDGLLEIDTNATASSGVTVGGTGTISGNGTLPFTEVQLGGTILPGAPGTSGAHTGALTVDHGLYLNGGGIRIELDGASSGELVLTGDNSGYHTLSGELTIAPYGTGYTPGNTYMVLDASASDVGFFDSLTVDTDTSNAPGFDSGILVNKTDFQNVMYITFQKECLTLFGGARCAPDAGDFVWKANPLTDRLYHDMNWSSGVAPRDYTDQATFSTSSVKSVVVSTQFYLAGFTFDADGGDYVFDLNDVDNIAPGQLNFSDVGIIDNHTSGAAPVFHLHGTSTMAFNGTATAGDITVDDIDGQGTIYFTGGSAGSATLGTVGGEIGTITFNQSSPGPILGTAGTATIRANTLNFYGHSNAGSAAITAPDDGAILFYDSSALDSTIHLDGARSTLTFASSATAGNATIYIEGTKAKAIFDDSSDAGTATIHNDVNLIFKNNAAGGTGAKVINSSAADIDASQSTSGAVSLGSLNGSGTVHLGATQLSLNALGAGDVFGGVIADGGLNDATGGSLVVTGGGKLTLTGVNTHTGLTSASGGTTLQIGDGDSSTASVASTSMAIGPGATIAFNRANYTLDAAVTGSGVITQLAGTTLTITQNDGVGLTIVKGTVNLGGGGATGLVAGTVTVNAAGTLVFDRSNVVLFAGALTGSGHVVKNNSNAVIVTHDGAFTGTVTINGGTIQLGNGGFNGSLAGAAFDVGLSGRLFYELNTHIEPDITHYDVNSLWSGNGTVEVGGNAPIVMHTAGSTLTGTVQIDPGATLTGGAANVFAANAGYTVNGTLNLGGFDQTIGGLASSIVASHVTLGGHTLSINGHGPIVTQFDGSFTGGGVVDLSGATDLTITQDGTSTFFVVHDPAALHMAGTSNATFSGAVSGDGLVSIEGNWSLTFTGDNTNFTGRLQVVSGTTLVAQNNASLPGAVHNAGIVDFSTGDSSSINYAGSLFGTGTAKIDSTTTLAGAIYQNDIDNHFNLFIDSSNGNQAFSGDLTGSGAIQFTGTHNTTLSGDNSGLSIAAVGIDPGATVAMTNGTWNSIIVNHGNLVFDTSGGDITFDKQVTAGFSVGTTGVIGGGKLTLTNASSNNNLNAGTGSTLSLAFAADGGATGTLAGAGHLSIDGTHVTTFALDDSAFTGTIGVSAGATMKVLFQGMLSHDVANNGTVEFGAGNVLNYGEAITGSGHVVVDGGGVVTLTNAGLDNDLVDNGTLHLAFATNTTFAKTIGGAGQLTLDGHSEFTLTGDSHGFTGQTAVNAGTLSLASTLGGTIDVRDGGTLAGNGTSGSDVTVENGGTLAPGNSIGTLHIGGDLTLDAGSHYAVEFSPTAADEAVVTGDIALAGALDLTATGGSYAAGQYTIMTGRAVSGTFSVVNVSGGLIGLSATVQYESTDVLLILTRAGTQWAANPVSSDWNTGANWEGGSVPPPDFQASFAASTITTVNVNQADATKGLAFEAGAPAYTINVAGTAAGDASLTVGSDGVIDASSNKPTLTTSGANGHTGTLTFTGASTADAVLVANAGGTIAFTGTVDSSASRVIVNGGTFDLTAANSADAFGSLEGTGGAVALGGNALSVGGLGTSTVFGGAINGSGSLVKTGAGTLALAGANAYTGGTTISGGTLQVGNGGATGSIVGAINDNAVLAFNRTGTLVVGGAITGSGSVQQIGTGTTVLTGNSSYTGGTTISAGTLQIGSGGTSGAIIGAVNDNGVLAFNRSDAVTFAGLISGVGGVRQAGSGTTVLTANNTYMGATVVAAGTLQLGNGGATGAVAGAITDNATLAVNHTGTFTLGNLITGSGAFVQAGGTTIITALNSYGGGTTVAAGTLQLGHGGNSGSFTGNVIDNGVLAVDRSDVITFGPASGGGSPNTQFGGAISGSGAFVQMGTGTTILTATNTYTGGTTIAAGTLQIGEGHTFGSIVGNVFDNGRLIFNRSDAVTFDGTISGSGTLVKRGTGTLVLTADNTVGGVTTISAGTLQLGNGGTSGSVAGAIVDNAALVVDRAGAVTLSAISGSGTLTKIGSGILTLTGAGTYAGGTDVAGGTLAVDGSVTSAVTVEDGATLGGTGTVGSADVKDGAVLAAGDGGVGTLHVAGNLTLESGAQVVAEIGTSAADEIMVGGATTIAGDLTVVGSGGAFTAGQYTLINSVATLSGTFDTLHLLGSFGGFDVDLKYDDHNVILVLDLGGVRWKADPVSGDWNTGANWLTGNVPAATDKAYFGQSTVTTVNINQATTIAGINIAVGAPAYTFNVAATAGADSSLTVSGSGIGDASSNKPTFVVAGNGAHTATLTFADAGPADAILTANSSGTVAFTGSATGGTSQAVVNAGGTLAIAGLTNGGIAIGSIEGAGVIVLGANTLTEGNLNTSTTFSGVISGSGRLTKVGAGTLTLTGANTYTGVTTISGGAVQIGNGGTSGSIAGGVSDNSLLAFNRSDAVTYGGAISGTGAVSQIGTGTTTLTGANTYTGGTLIAAGTLQVGNSGVAGSIVGDVTDNAALVINRSGTLTLDGVISGTGTLTQAGSATTVLVGANTYSGTTSISAGTLQIGAGGTSGSLGSGAVVDSGVLAFNRSDAIVVTNAVSGTGSLQQNGSGMTALTGSSTYAGGTTVSAGVLILGNGGAAGSITGNVTDNATFAVNRSDAYTFAGAISGAGAFVQAGTGTTILIASNTYASGTLVQQGTLQLGNGGATGSITGDVDDEGVLAFNRSDVVTFGGAISGAGSVRQIGSGTTVLIAANSYTGGTTVVAGTLQLGNGGTAGSITGNVADNGTLVFNRSDAVLFDGTISGSGAVKQIGAGVTVLAGANTYTGGTTISAGTLRIGNGSTAGSIAGNVVDNGTLEFNRSDALSFAGVISGTGGVSQIGGGTTTLGGASTYSGATNVSAGTLQAGAVNAFSASSSYAVAAILDLNNFSQAIGSLSGAGSVTLGSGSLTTGGDNSSTLFAGVIGGSGGLTKAGAGTFTLTGANTYSGGTTIAGGTLRIGNGGAIGSITGNVIDNGTLMINHSDDVLFSGTISGSGALVQAGAGRTALTAANTYTGGTTISAGALVMGNGGTAGSIVGNVIDNASFVINRTDNITFAGAVSGTGSLTKMNANTLILTGNSTYTGGTAFDGTLQLGNGGTSGAVVGNVANNGLLIVNRSDTITLAGVISGAGGLNQVGTGMTVLSGVSTYSGPTLVTAGILDVNGSIANSAVTLNGGQLKGNGTVGSLTILSGSLAPGNSIGTLNVAGNFVMAPGTNYNVEVNGAGQSDRLNVGGIATLGGGTVLVAAAPNDKYAQHTTYRIVAAAGGVAGNFAGAAIDLPFFNVSLSYSTTAVDLILDAKQIDFSGLTLTPNEQAAANAINAGGFNTDLYKAFLNQPSNAFVPAALDSLSGEVHPSIRTALIQDSRNARDAILDRLRDANGSLAGGASNARPMSADAAMWVRVFTNWGNADGDGNAATLGQSFSGIMAGGDVKLHTLTLGIAGGYTHESLSVKGRASRTSSGDGHIGGYAGWTGGPVSLRAGVEYAWGNATVTRTVQFPGFANNLGDKESRHSTQVFGEAGYGMDFGHVSLEPFVSAAWVNAGSGAFAETGGIAALTGASGSSSVTFTDLGVRFAADGGFLTPRASLAWQHAFGDVRPGQIVQFASTQQNFLVLGVPLDRDALAAEVGVDIALSDATHLGLGYDGVISSRVQSHAARADFIWNF